MASWATGRGRQSRYAYRFRVLHHGRRGKWRPIQVVNGHQIPFDRGFDTLEEAATVLTLPDQFKRMEVYVAQRPERHLASGVVACLMGWALATVWAIDLRQIVAGAVLMLTVSLVHDAIDAERLAR